ncbi:MAG: replicative DNA helicase, partial [Deltaproteobacteria bacterium]
RISEIIDGNIETLEERQGNKALVTGVPTGFTRLDNLTSGLQQSELIILAARPSMGKTALALNIARNAAVDANIPVAIFSLEMSKEQLSMRLLCSEARIDSSRLRGGFFSMEDWRKLTDAAGVLSDTSIFIDDTPDISAMEIRAKARRLKMEKDIGLVIIDYLQLMKGRMSAERRDLEISEISRSLKALAKELDIPVMALSQLNRMLEQRNDKQPRLSDLRESGALEQDADVVAFIYRDEIYNSDENNPKKGMADILLRKNRNGPTGEATLTFLDSYTRFENLAFEK